MSHSWKLRSVIFVLISVSIIFFSSTNFRFPFRCLPSFLFLSSLFFSSLFIPRRSRLQVYHYSFPLHILHIFLLASLLLFIYFVFLIIIIVLFHL